MVKTLGGVDFYLLKVLFPPGTYNLEESPILKNPCGPNYRLSLFEKKKNSHRRWAGGF